MGGQDGQRLLGNLVIQADAKPREVSVWHTCAASGGTDKAEAGEILIDIADQTDSYKGRNQDRTFTDAITHVSTANTPNLSAQSNDGVLQNHCQSKGTAQTHQATASLISCQDPTGH